MISLRSERAHRVKRPSLPMCGEIHNFSVLYLHICFDIHKHSPFLAREVTSFMPGVWYSHIMSQKEKKG
jgi:hypothetical protein